MDVCAKYITIIKQNHSDDKQFLYKALRSFEMFDTSYNSYLNIEQVKKACTLLFMRYNIPYKNWKNNIYKYHNTVIQNDRQNMLSIRDEISALKEIKKVVKTMNNTENIQDVEINLWNEFDRAIGQLKIKNRHYFKDFLLLILSTNADLTGKDNIHYYNDIKDYLSSNKTICICNSVMNLKKKEECYDINTCENIVCDFSGVSIHNDILHCDCKKTNPLHPTGFDVSKSYMEAYMEDLIYRRTEKRLYLSLLDMEKVDESRNTHTEKYLRYKYEELCKYLIDKTIFYYINTKNDLENIMYNNDSPVPINIIKLKTRLLGYKRILSIKKDWYECSLKKIDLLSKNIVIYHNFIVNLCPKPKMFNTELDKNKFINKQQEYNSRYVSDFKKDIENLANLERISYEIVRKSCLTKLTNLVAEINNLIYKSYEEISILENCTTNDKMIKFIKTQPTDNDICTICQTNYDDSEIDNQLIVKIFKCGHIFHENCILEWLVRSNTCPLCR